MEAARSLGMTRAQAMIHIILPQGIKNSLPAICNEFIINIKDTSVFDYMCAYLCAVRCVRGVKEWEERRLFFG